VCVWPNQCPRSRDTSHQKSMARIFRIVRADGRSTGWIPYIFALVMVPALKELLPRSGLRQRSGRRRPLRRTAFRAVLVGLGLARFCGVPSRTSTGAWRTLMFTILWYSLFTFLCCISTRVWQLAIFRFLAGLASAASGDGRPGLWRKSGPRTGARWRRAGCTRILRGIFLAALANYQIGARYGWRWMFASADCRRCW